MLSSYLYDAGGERVWKLSNDESSLRLRGNSVHRSVKFNKTLYISPLMVMNEQEYTKHYFIEGERVCTKVGGGFRYAPTDPDAVQLQFMGTSTATSVSDDLWTMTIRGVDCSGYPSARVSVKPKLRPARNDASRAESQQYFYHPDHLGSSSFLTDAAGLVEQHLQYLPFGESFIDQRNGYSSRYTFSAKEKDDETQYSYFGARYYDSDLSVWLSVDPASDEYASTSPYMYVRGNPIRLVDPNGMWDSEHIDEFGNMIAHYDDGDKGVYVHKTGTTEADIDKVHSADNTSAGGDKIGELGGSIDMDYVLKNKLLQSSGEARAMDIVSYFFAVRPKGKWDLKKNTNTIWGIAWQYDSDHDTKTTFSYGSYSDMSAADVGNYHAGFTGRYTYCGGGMPYQLLQQGAGAVETFKSVTERRFTDAAFQYFMLSNGIEPYGDRVIDFNYNTEGMKDADAFKANPYGNRAGSKR